jgi:hypothetical protein
MPSLHGILSTFFAAMGAANYLVFETRQRILYIFFMLGSSRHSIAAIAYPNLIAL